MSISGCTQEGTGESVLCGQKTVESQKLPTVRWAIVEENECAELPGQAEYMIEEERKSNVNHVLNEKGYSMQVDIDYILVEDGKNALETIQNQKEAYDIITFQVMGIGADEMERELLPLDRYMAENGPLYNVYEQFPKEVWEYDKIDGHNYNVGQLTQMVYPMFTVFLANERDYNQEILAKEGYEVLPQIVEKMGRSLKMAEPFSNIYEGEDELGIQCFFHMIAPGVGLNVENGTEFEVVWESEEVKDLIDRELTWIQEGVCTSYYDTESNASKELFRRFVTQNPQIRNEMYREAGRKLDMIPLVNEGRVVPMEGRYFTSVLKNAEHLEESLELLRGVNTDMTLFEALRDPVAKPQSGRKVKKFEELCINGIPNNEEGVLLWKEQIEQVKPERISPILGFTFDQRSVGEEMLALKRVQKEGTGFIQISNAVYRAEENGENVPMATIEAWKQEFSIYVERLKKAGIDRVVEEANRQLAEWITKQNGGKTE